MLQYTREPIWRKAMHKFGKLLDNMVKICLSKVFSVKKTSTHKVFTILFFKFKKKDIIKFR